MKKRKISNKPYIDMIGFAHEFLHQTYGIDSCPIIEIDNRLNDCLAKLETYQTEDGKDSVRVVVSKRVVDYYTMKEQMDIIKHELVHYALALKGKGYKDGDSDFENELDRLNIPHQDQVQLRGKVHIYSCNYEHDEIELHRTVKRTNVENRICPICKHPMKWKGTYLITKNDRTKVGE